MTAERQVLSVDEVAAITGLSPHTVRAWARDRGQVLGVPPISDTGRRVLFSRRLIEAAIHGTEADKAAS